MAQFDASRPMPVIATRLCFGNMFIFFILSDIAATDRQLWELSVCN
jgi:hypothetical protein